MYKYI